MTAPFTDWGAYFSDPQARQNELNQYNAMVDAFRQAFGRQQALGVGMTLQGATYPEAQQQGPITPDWHDDDLVGAAVYWGIPEETARQLPREGLIQILNDKRQARTQVDVPDKLSYMAITGAAQGLVHGLFNLPFVGESMRRIELLQRADFQLHKMEEAVRSTSPEDMQWAMTGANVTGNVAAMWYPAAGAWNVAGKMGQIIPFLKGSKYALAAFQGGASTYMLEGGSDAFKEHPLLMTGAGIGLGLTGEYVAQKLAARVTKSFVPPAPTPPPPPSIPPTRIVTGPGQFSEAFQPPMGPEIPPGGLRSAAPSMAGSAEGQVLSGADAFFGFQQNAPVIPAPVVSAPITSEPALASQTPSVAGPLPDDFEILTNILHGPRIPKGFTLDETGALVSQLNKSATIVQSPAFPTIAGQAAINDVSVLAAAEATNPGGLQVIQGVANPAEFINAMPANTHFVPVGNRLDALVIPAGADPNRIIQQYQKFGLFEGQRVLTAEGIEGSISAIDNNGALFTPAFSGPPREVGINELQGWLTSGVTQDVPQVWDGFVQYAAQRSRLTAQAMQAGENAIGSINAQNLPIYAEDFLTELGIQDAGQRAGIINYFNKRYVQAFKDLAPVESALQDAAAMNYNNTAQTTPLTPLQALDEIAASKGYIVIPDGTGVIIKDLQASAGTEAAQIRLDSIETATEMLRNLNRELPDITPPSSVPLEVMGMIKREPTQGANLNHGVAEQAARSATEIPVGDGGDGLPPELIIAQNGGPNNVGRIKNFWSDRYSKSIPMRRWFSRGDEALHQAGYDIGYAGDFAHTTQINNLHHTDLNPWMDELTDIVNQIKPSKMVSGEWARLAGLQPAERAAAASAKGFSAAEIAAYDQLDSYLQRVVQTVNGTSDPVNTAEIWEFFNHIGKRQSDPATVATAFDHFPLSPSTQAFYDFAKTGNLNFRELDPRHVIEGYVRSLFWMKNMEAPFTAMDQKYLALEKIPELQPAARMMRNWLSVMRYGYSIEDDQAVHWMHAALGSILGEEVTPQMAREVLNGGLNATHRGMLGWRPHIMARDALQLFLAIPRAGMDLLRVIGRFATSEEARIAIMDEAIAEGAVMAQSPRLASPGALSGELERLGVQSTELGGTAVPPLQGDAGWRMQLASKLHTAIADLVPSWLRDTQHSILDPLYFYGKQSEVMRAMVYTAGKEKAANALANFRAGGSTDLAGLMQESSARTYDPSWQREFQKFVAAGDDTGAAKFLGQQLVSATQFDYGILQSPWAAKSITGRMVMQMGNYQMQYLQYLRESFGAAGRTIAANPKRISSYTDAAKIAMTFGAVTYGLEAATRETGWNFRWMNPFFGLGFTGGPWVTIVPEMLRAGGDVVRELQGGNPNEAVRAGGAAALGQAAENLNPLGGLVRTVQGAGEAITTSPYPGRALARLAITGERGNEPDVNQWLLPQATQMFQQSLSQQPNPVSATQYGLPAGVFPQQPSAYPPLVGFGSSPMPNGNQTPVVPPAGVGGGANYRPAPGVAATYDEINQAASGNQQALQKFSPEDQQFLLSLGPVPPDVRLAAWSQYKAVQINQQLQRMPTGNPGGYSSGLGAGTPFPGAGGQQ